MSNPLDKAISWMGDHPVLVAVAVFAVGGMVLLSLNKGGGGSSDGGMGAFYAAQSAQQASNNQVNVAQVQGQTAVALAQVQGTTATGIATLATQRDTAIAQMNSDLSSKSLDLAKEAQNKAYWQGVGQDQLEGQALPYLLQAIESANPLTSSNAADTLQAFIHASQQYYAAPTYYTAH